MQTKELAIRGVAFNWLGRGCSFVVTFFVTPILIHRLGNTAYGLWALVVSLTGYYALSNLGVRAAAIKYISQHTAKNDRLSMNRVVVTALGFHFAVGLFITLAAAVVAYVFPSIYGTASEAPGTIRLVVFITGVNVAIKLFGEIFRATLVAHNRFDIASSIAITSQIIESVLLVAIVATGGGLLGMAYCVLGIGIATEIASYFLVCRVVDDLSLKTKYLDLATLKTLFGFGSLTIIAAGAHQVASTCGNLFVGLFIGPAYVVFYEIPQRFIAKALDMTMGVTSVVYPLASQLDSQQRRDDLLRMLQIVSQGLLASALLCALLSLFLGNPLIQHWIGPEYAPQAYPVLCILAAYLVIRLPCNCARNILSGIGRVGFLATTSVLQAVILLVLGWALLETWGLIGMAWATVIAEAIVGLGLVLVVTCKVIGIRLVPFVSRTVLRSIAANGPALVVVAALATWVPPSNLAWVVAYATLTSAVGGLGIFAFCLDRDLRASVLRSVNVATGLGSFFSNPRRDPKSRPRRA